MKAEHTVTIDQLREIIRAALVASGWSEAEIAGYVRAHEVAGWLRPACPQWMRNSGAVIYQTPPLGRFSEKPPAHNSAPGG